jgi:hypothetical protein
MTLLRATLTPIAKDVKIKISYRGNPQAVLAVYNYQLKSDEANQPVESHEGDNQNCQDDIFSLPTPIGLNVGRFILIRSQIAAVNVDTSYSIIVEVIQDGEVTDTLENKGVAKANGSSVLAIDKINFQ